MRPREGDKMLGMYEKRKEIEKSLQKAVHPLIRQRSEGRAWESLVEKKRFWNWNKSRLAFLGRVPVFQTYISLMREILFFHIDICNEKDEFSVMSKSRVYFKAVACKTCQVTELDVFTCGCCAAMLKATTCTNLILPQRRIQLHNPLHNDI